MRRTVAVLAAAMAVLVTQANAQRAARWELADNDGGYCVWYLVEPTMAAALVPAGTPLLAAGHAPALHPSLAFTIQDEPRLQSWIPASICVGFYQQVTVDGQVVARAKHGVPILVGTSAIETTAPRGQTGARSYLIDLLTDAGAVRSAAGRAGMGTEAITLRTRLRRGADDPIVTIETEGVIITWSGHPTADSSVGRTRTVSFGYEGKGHLGGTMSWDQGSRVTRVLVGALEVGGTNSLAKALRASPIRAIGPAAYGGVDTVTFQVESHP